jgi:hypothetical protein
MNRTHRTARILGALFGVALCSTTLALAPAAQAGSTKLCTGRLPCLVAGRSDGGYTVLSFRPYWTQVTGHNCTNYIAYRLTHGGRMVARPPGTAGAATWAAAARAWGVPVDDRPKVGDVAWWPAGVPGSPTGHVAYVEQVMSDGSILVSEDNLGGDFDWRKLTRGTGWPSGFIHYPRSNGSPQGVFTSVSSPVAGQIDFWATSADPDSVLLEPGYLVTLGGPRGTPGVETFTFTSPYFTFHRIKTVKTRGKTTMYLYALNTLLTAGSDVLLGSRPVTIRSASTTTAAMVDSTITAGTVPQIKVTLAPSAAGGKVDITRGSTVLKSITVTPGGTRTFTVSLPKQAKGTHAIQARYLGSTTYLASSAAVSLVVR